MCQESNTFIFCTCIEKSKKTENAELLFDYTWNLSRWTGSRQSNIRGKIIGAKTDIGHGITLENILSQLNKNNLFDFDYTPTEGDSLRITSPDPIERIKIIGVTYRYGNWTSRITSPFTSVLEEIAKGKIFKIDSKK